MIHEFSKPIPCHTPLGEGYILYVKANGFLENDEFCIILKNGGDVRHMLSTDINIYPNTTYGIFQKNPVQLPF